MIDTAVILAAGLGSRLGKRVIDKPKGFLEIEGKAIIEMSIEKLIQSGIKEIIIGTGYLHLEYDKLMLKYPQVKCIYNQDYTITGSMYTLYCLKGFIKKDFILLESDLIYDKLAIDVLLHNEKDNVLLVSEFTGTHDEVFVEADEYDLLANISKQSDELSSIKGELVGITKISLECCTLMCDYMKNNYGSNPKLDYEQALASISKKVNVFVNKVIGLNWCEIDDEVHLERAVNEIYPQIKEKESNKFSIPRKILLNPGPATTTNSVKCAQLVPDICPREKEFGELMKFVFEELVNIVGNTEEYAAVLFGGSGTAAVEAVLSSVVGENSILVINNGAYGKRMCEICRIYGMNLIEFQSSKYEAVNLEELETVITTTNKKISHLAVIHNETTTGLLNKIEVIGDLCRKYDIDFIVDAMSSFAALPIDMKRMNISYLASSSNKNIQGLPGVSFVIANKLKLENLKNLKPRNLYLNLYAQYRYFLDNYQMRFTPPVQTLYALKQAIIEAKREGLENRYKRYSESWETLIKGIEKLGLTYLVKRENHSRIITTIVEPKCEKYNFDEMHDYFYNQGITIYPGKVSDLNTFRVANIGDVNAGDIQLFLKLMEEYLKSIGFIV